LLLLFAAAALWLSLRLFTRILKKVYGM